MSVCALVEDVPREDERSRNQKIAWVLNEVRGE